jgi:hypothetical protein
MTDSPKPTAQGLQFYMPAQAKWKVESGLGALPGGERDWFVLTHWLRGHEWQAIEIIVASFFGGNPLDGAERMLAALPGVYRIARFDHEGPFGRERGEKRRQVRALMAVNERALQDQPLGRGGWYSLTDDIVVYDPRSSRPPINPR